MYVRVCVFSLGAVSMFIFFVLYSCLFVLAFMRLTTKLLAYQSECVRMCVCESIIIIIIIIIIVSVNVTTVCVYAGVIFFFL